MANMTRRSLVAGLGGTMASLALAACGNSSTDGASGSTDAAGKSFKIGVLQLVEHDALDAANAGFVTAIQDSGLDVKIDQQNAQGDQSACQTIATKLVNDGNDLILAIATPSVEAVAGATDQIPIVGTAVTDFEASGLVASNEKPGGNITGTSDLTPVEEQIALIPKFLPDAKTVGILYCTAESNSDIQVKMAEDACKANGLTPERYSVASSNEIQQVVESAVNKVDVLYAPTDNVIAAGFATVAMVANEKGIPTVCGEKGMIDAGGLVTISIDYLELGKRAGEMALRILTEGANPADMPIEHLDFEECELITSEETAKKLGIDLSPLSN